DDGEIDVCADLFAEDAVYIRPTMLPDANGNMVPGPLAFVNGREAIRTFFVERGKQNFRHYVRRELFDESIGFVEGQVITNDGVVIQMFSANALIDSDGKIARYVALAKAITPDEGARLDASAEVSSTSGR